MDWQFIKELFKGVFWSYRSIASWLGFVVFMLCLLLPKLKLESKMKKGLETVSWPYRFLIILGLLFISIILTSSSIYNNQQQQIDALQKQIRDIKRVDNPKVKAAAIPYIKSPRPRPHLQLREPANISRPSLKGIIEPNK